jgi:hypothetical protein
LHGEKLQRKGHWISANVPYLIANSSIRPTFAFMPEAINLPIFHETSNLLEYLKGIFVFKGLGLTKVY